MTKLFWVEKSYCLCERVGYGLERTGWLSSEVSRAVLQRRVQKLLGLRIAASRHNREIAVRPKAVEIISNSQLAVTIKLTRVTSTTSAYIHAR